MNAIDESLPLRNWTQSAGEEGETTARGSELGFDSEPGKRIHVVLDV